MLKRLIVLFAISLVSTAQAQDCGFLDLGESDIFEMQKDGILYDSDGNLVSELVPNVSSLEAKIGKNKISVTDTTNYSKSSSSLQLHFLIEIPKSKGKKAVKLSAVKREGDYLAFIDKEHDRFLLLDGENGEVFQALISKSIKKNKLSFSVIPDAYFGREDCSDGSDDGDDEPDDSTPGDDLPDDAL